MQNHYFLSEPKQGEVYIQGFYINGILQERSKYSFIKIKGEWLVFADIETEEIYLLNRLHFPEITWKNDFDLCKLSFL